MTAVIVTLPRCKKLRNRRELSFVSTWIDGSYRRFNNWSPERAGVKSDQRDGDFEYGLSLIRELQMLQKGNEQEAFCAIKFALNSRNWKPGHDVEDGFADGIASLAIVGMRALVAGAAPFDPDQE
ncbi:hypothetical protein HNP46_004348 [Pseudomonas nitritireducens]|uniref:Uncharacterized protein n=1 Tax=Pseudomonas nitroreducens TaxID=46680 RepID=A0A7W7KMC2_PSENT|nr:hypothetical protein [Pseudomonas nitritireducens]MBB4865454.1 hypothetical protein [Pseudomonas nitritireducens]